jgi:hypothetical protein
MVKMFLGDNVPAICIKSKCQVAFFKVVWLFSSLNKTKKGSVMKQRRFSEIRILFWALLLILSGATNQALGCGTIIGSVDSYKVGDIHVSGAYAYFTYQSGLKIIDISDPYSPEISGEVSIGAYCGKFDISGSYAYVTEGRIISIWPEIKTLGYFNIVDISDPENPFVVNSIQILEEPYHYVRDISVNGSNAYIVTNDQGMKVFDISNPQNPTLLTSFSLDSSWASSINISGNYAYVGTADDGLKVIDISNPESPSMVKTVDNYGLGSSEIVGNYLYAANGNLAIFDISDPRNPLPIGSVSTPKIASDVAVIGPYAFVADGSDSGGSTLMIDIRDLNNPITLCSIHSDDGPSAVFASDPYVYAGDDFGFHIISFDLLSKPTIARTPTSGPPGTTFTLSGTGFTPNSTAKLYTRHPDNSEHYMVDVDIDETGKFEINYGSPIDEILGTYYWWVVDGTTFLESNEVSYEIREPYLNIFSVGPYYWDYFPTVNDFSREAIDTYNTFNCFAENKGYVFNGELFTKNQSGNLTCDVILDMIRYQSTTLVAGDILVFSFSGHGYEEGEKVLIKTPEFYGGESCNITADDLYSALAGIADRGSEIIIIIDACYSSSFKNKLKRLGKRTYIYTSGSGTNIKWFMDSTWINKYNRELNEWFRDIHLLTSCPPLFGETAIAEPIVFEILNKTLGESIVSKRSSPLPQQTEIDWHDQLGLMIEDINSIADIIGQTVVDSDGNEIIMTTSLWVPEYQRGIETVPSDLDFDCDVDGSDLAEVIISGEISIQLISEEFGRTGCL